MKKKQQSWRQCSPCTFKHTHIFKHTRSWFQVLKPTFHGNLQCLKKKFKQTHAAAEKKLHKEYVLLLLRETIYIKCHRVFIVVVFNVGCLLAACMFVCLLVCSKLFGCCFIIFFAIKTGFVYILFSILLFHLPLVCLSVFFSTFVSFYTFISFMYLFILI